VAGLLLALAGTTYLFKGCRWKSEVPGEVVKWTSGLFALHCLTGVQTQFPILFFLLLIGWGITSQIAPPEECGERSVSVIARGLVALSLLLLVVLNTYRIASHFERALGFQLYRLGNLKAASSASRFLASSSDLMPIDELAWYQRGLLADALGQRELSRDSAVIALSLDERWAAPWELFFRHQKLPRRSDVERAIEIDPINYPSFYRVLAELKIREGSHRSALELLQANASRYHPRKLDSIASFRATDLKDQMVEYWLLLAILREREAKADVEPALRMAFHFSENRVSRLQRMVSYSQKTGIPLGPVVHSVLAQVSSGLSTVKDEEITP
jgi:hypothetical protein